ncbi:hypothetical protein CANARDRAFT_26134 [[Candida] arabinofermentans NRRL YB-2248]|uniref:Uncharacterized protein n=1 Tax=[Candida] arabinofermentans NRRL YB-2248 TaxID=983967 RepID=A0A1E4T898_9ASCO|nr:hypothetical protein CANARDRAFT_26134 [[Candida] arabinofermentans NRRL YB-2248]
MYKVDEVWGDGPSNDLTDDTDNRSNSDSVDGKYKYEHRLEIVSDSQHKKDLEQSHQDAIESVSNDVITVDESNDHADYVDPNTFPQTLTIDNMTLKLFSFKNIENKGDKVLPDPINFEVEKVDI